MSLHTTSKCCISQNTIKPVNEFQSLDISTSTPTGGITLQRKKGCGTLLWQLYRMLIFTLEKSLLALPVAALDLAKVHKHFWVENFFYQWLIMLRVCQEKRMSLIFIKNKVFTVDAFRNFCSKCCSSSLNIPSCGLFLWNGWLWNKSYSSQKHVYSLGAKK